jgi:hypothetical protein
MKTFVANRIAEIHELTEIDSWRHIPTAENPADIISRGLQPEQLKDATLWWSGPTFTNDDESSWPRTSITITEDQLPEMKQVTALVIQQSESWSAITKFSEFLKLQRVMAYVWRFIDNCKSVNPKRSQALTVSEMSSSLSCIIRIVQREAFHSEITDIQEGKQIDKKSLIKPLNVFLDDQQLLRVGGRLQNSRQPFETKHQIVLPKNHHITLILIRGLHQQNGHAGQQALLAIVRQQYWPLGAKDVIRQVTRKCVKCFKYKPTQASQFMGDLPIHRVVIHHAFVNVGLDYCGPITLKLTRRTSTKAYVAIFVCMATKACHIELVSDLTSKAFIAALSRFVSRRGHCQNIYSDNGTNFVGAQKELSQLYELLKDSVQQEAICNALTPMKIQFHFIPPRAPHFGGLWEAAVKSTKFHMNRIVGNTPLYFEELATVLSKIEAILNSRPLVPSSDDPEDTSALTPGHFLIGRPLVALLEPNYQDVPTNSLRRWQLLQKLTQHFWNKWSSDYLTSLQRRSKVAGITTIQINTMVLLKEDNLPPSQWCLGRITELHPGNDGVVRVVSVKTKNGVYKRPLVKVCLLPIPAEEPVSESTAAN